MVRSSHADCAPWASGIRPLHQTTTLESKFSVHTGIATRLNFPSLARTMAPRTMPGIAGLYKNIRKNMGKKHVRNITKAMAALAAMMMSAPAIAGWEPTKPVEIVVAAGAGGAVHQQARVTPGAAQQKKLCWRRRALCATHVAP